MYDTIEQIHSVIYTDTNDMKASINLVGLLVKTLENSVSRVNMLRTECNDGKFGLE